MNNLVLEMKASLDNAVTVNSKLVALSSTDHLISNIDHTQFASIHYLSH